MNCKNKLFTGDNIDIINDMPNNIIDLSITSPPYNKGAGKNKGWLVDSVDYNDYHDTLPEDVYQDSQIELLNSVYNATKRGGSFFYNHKIRWNKGNMYHPMDWIRKSQWIVKQEIIWDRMISANIRGWRFWQVDERIYWLYKPKSSKKSMLIGNELDSRHAKFTSIWRGKPEDGRRNKHPAPFPIWLPSRIINSILGSNIGGKSYDAETIVLDPYSGSGTTVVASKLLGHGYIGIDISEEYTKMAQGRLDVASNELKKVQEELLKHRIDKTFRDRKIDGSYVGKFGVSEDQHDDELETISMFDGYEV